MNLQQMQNALAIRSIPACFAEFYPSLESTYLARSREILAPAYIQKALSDCHALEDYRDLVLAAAEEVGQNEAMCLLVCLLEQWLRSDGNMADAAYTPPEGEGLAFDFLHLFPVIPTIPENMAHLRNRGLPEEIIFATMGEYDFCVNMCNTRMGRPAFDRSRLNWISRLVHNRLIRIGRFKYDLPGTYMKGARVYRNAAGDLTILADDLLIHRSGRILGSVGHTDEEGSFHALITETEDTFIGHKAVDGIVEKERTILPKAQWSLCLSPEDPMPQIHIPSEGSFDRKTIADAFAQAKEIFARCYPDYPFKAIFCSTWLLSRDLRKILKPTSNILGFQDFFTYIPFQSNGKLVFSFAFRMSPAIPEDLEALPENTSLLRAVKQLYLEGGYVHEGAGFFF